MDLLETMLKRRSIRKYGNEDISKEKLDKILKAGLLAPTSRNRKPCSFLVVENREILKKLSEVKEYGSAFLKDANKAVIVIANEEIADTWVEDSSIALSFMHLMATEVGVGSCWIQVHLRKSAEGIDSEKLVRDIVKIDDYFRIVGILALGILDGVVAPHKIDEVDKSKIHFLL